jgi:hypothetical protein
MEAKDYPIYSTIYHPEYNSRNIEFRDQIGKAMVVQLKSDAFENNNRPESEDFMEKHGVKEIGKLDRYMGENGMAYGYEKY